MPDMELSPNPVTDRVHGQLPNAAIGRIDLIDPQGRIMHVTSGKGDDMVTLPLELFDSGQYLIHIETSNGPMVRKLVIERGRP